MTTLTPRKDFRESKLAAGWGDVVTSPQFEAAAKAAMLEYQIAVMTGNQPAENAFRLHGALQFLDTLMRLADTPTIPKPLQTGLSYT